MLNTDRFQENYCTYCGKRSGHSLACPKSLGSVVFGSILYAAIALLFLIDRFVFGRRGADWAGITFFGIVGLIVLVVKVCQWRRIRP